MNKIENIAKRYYDFILKYEKYNEKYKKNTDIDLSDLSNADKELMDNLIKCFEEISGCTPWKKIQGNLLDGLQKVFSANTNEYFDYLKVEDYLFDTYISLATEDLKKYYKDKGYDITNDLIIDKITDESFDSKFDENLDTNKYSEGTIELQVLFKELSNVCEELFNFYNKNDKNIETVNQDEIER